jgi:hypothetical protein
LKISPGLTSRKILVLSRLMDIRSLPDAVANVMLGVANELDETAIDHGLVHGSTVTGRAMRFVATGLVVGAMPWVILDFATGGHRRRGDSDSWSEMATDEDDTTISADANPVWWGFLSHGSRPSGR